MQKELCRVPLPEQDASIRCMDCGKLAFYKINHDNAFVMKEEYYCKTCCE